MVRVSTSFRKQNYERYLGRLHFLLFVLSPFIARSKKRKLGGKLDLLLLLFFFASSPLFPSAFQRRSMIPQFYSIEIFCLQHFVNKKNQIFDCLFFLRHVHLALSRKQSVSERSDADLRDFAAKRKVKSCPLSPKDRLKCNTIPVETDLGRKYKAFHSRLNNNKSKELKQLLWQKLCT